MKNRDYLEKILPHKEPMILIDDVIRYSIDEKWLMAEVSIDETSQFYDKQINGVPAIVGIEYMAQAIGCYAYYRNDEKKPKIGYLLGTKKYNIKIDKFAKNQKYIIRVEEIFLDEALASFSCFIYNKHNDIIADSTVTVYHENK